MAQPNIVTTTNEYKIPKGNVLYNPLINSVYQGFMPLGNCPAFTINVTTDTLEHTNSQGGLSVVDLKVPIKITRSAKITCDNLNTDNLLLYLSAEDSTVTQSATSVTDYAIPAVNAGRTYQLGATANNPTGVRQLEVDEVRIGNGDTASARVNSTVYAQGALYVPATPNLHFYVCTAAGTSAGSPPTFKTDGTTFTDGTATFKDAGLIIVANASDADYLVDGDLGLISIQPTGAIATVVSLLATYDIDTDLQVDFTQEANSRQQIFTSSNSQLEGQLKFIADNPTGENQDVFMPSITLSASGDSQWVGEEITSMDFEVGINTLNSTTAAIYIDGRPV